MKGRLRVPTSGLAEGIHRLDAETSRYVLKVHRLEPGDEVLLFEPERGLEALGRLLEGRLDGARLSVEAPRRAEPCNMPVALLQALGKGDKPEQAIRDATVLGAERVVLLESERTVARSAGAERGKRHLRVSVEAARQSGRGDVPSLVGPVSFDEAVESEEAARKLVFAWHPSARPLLAALDEWSGLEPLALLVGPEGGLSSHEVDAALASGFEPVSLGPLVLRTETAATVALGVTRARWAVRVGARVPAG